MVAYTTALGFVAAALVGLVAPVAAYDTECIYENYKCGSYLVTADGYTVDELTAAVNATGTIPPLLDFQLMNVLYRCIDINGTLAGNSYCISGCIPMADFSNDQCAM